MIFQTLVGPRAKRSKIKIKFLHKVKVYGPWVTVPHLSQAVAWETLAAQSSSSPFHSFPIRWQPRSVLLAQPPAPETGKKSHKCNLVLLVMGPLSECVGLLFDVWGKRGTPLLSWTTWCASVIPEAAAVIWVPGKSQHENTVKIWRKIEPNKTERHTDRALIKPHLKPYKPLESNLYFCIPCNLFVT